MTQTFVLSRRSREHMEGVDPRLVEIAELAIKLTVIDFGVPRDGGVRTAERQRELFLSGASKCDGERRRSPHQTGRALDFFAYVDGKASWDTYHMAMVAAAFLQAACILGHRIEWGGLWHSFRDYPHVQLLDD